MSPKFSENKRSVLNGVAITVIASILLGACAAAPKAQTAASASDSALAVEASAGDISPLEEEARKKIVRLQAMIADAKADGHDITREEAVVWYANEFLKFANWDAKNQEAVEYAFSQYRYWAADAKQRAAEVPDFQRREVNNILDKAMTELTAVMEGEVTRRPVHKVDWQNIEVTENLLKSGGKPTFLYDYFSKSVGRPLTDEGVYNDYLGNIYHGGQRLYDVDHDRAINSFLLNEDGTWNEERLSYISEIPDTNVGFLYYWIMGIPEWVERREPEVRKGRSLFTGFDIDNPLVREVWGKIIRKTGEMTKGKKVTQLGFVLANEPHWYSQKGHWTAPFQEMQEISSYTRDKFRIWLDNKYGGDIAELNANWGTDFADFASVNIEIPIDKATQGTPVWYDWQRYNMDRAIDWFTFVQSELHSVNPDADTSIKIMPNMFTENNRSHGIDVEALTELTTMIGNDAKTHEGRLLRNKNPEPWEEHYSYWWEEMSVSYDFMESVSPGKIHFNSESHFLSSSTFRKMDMTIEYVRNVYWLATLQGMDANTGWFWARDPDGSFEDRLEGELNFFDPALAGSFVGSVNQQPHVANEVTQVMFDLNSYSEEIVALRAQRRPVRLFYSETSAINKPNHMSQQFKAYEKFFFEGIPVGYATQKIIEKQDNAQWDVITVYKTEFVTDGEFAALQAYLNDGGTVVLDNWQSLSKDEYGKPRAEKLTKGKGKLIVLGKSAGLDALQSAALTQAAASMPEVVMTQDNGSTHQAVTWRVVSHKDGGYLLNAINLGKTASKLTLAGKDDRAMSATDMMTGKALGSAFQIERNGVLLLHVKP